MGNASTSSTEKILDKSIKQINIEFNNSIKQIELERDEEIKKIRHQYNIKLDKECDKIKQQKVELYVKYQKQLPEYKQYMSSEVSEDNKLVFELYNEMLISINTGPNSFYCEFNE